MEQQPPSADKNSLPSLVRTTGLRLGAIQNELLNAVAIRPRVTKCIAGGHSDWVRDIVSSPDGKLLLTGSDDHTARLWDITTLGCALAYTGHTDTVRAVAFFPSGTRIVTGSWDRTLRIWETFTGACVNVIRGHTARIRAVRVSGDGRFVYSASEDATVRKWSAEGECLLVFRGHKKSVRDIELNDAEGVVFSADEEGVVIAWEGATGNITGTLKGHTDEVFTLLFEKNSNLLFAAGKDRTVRGWNTRFPERTFVYSGHSSWVMSLAATKDGKFLATAELDGITQIVDIGNAGQRFMHGGPTWVVNGVRFTDDSRSLVFASEHRVAKLDTASGRVIEDCRGHAKNVACIAIGRDQGTWASSSWDGTVILYGSGGAGKESRTISLSHPKTDGRGILSLCFSHDGSRLYAGSDNGYVTVWNTASGRIRKTIRVRADNVHAICAVPDDSRIIVACRDLADNICEYDSSNGKLTRSFAGHKNTVFSIDMSSDGRLLASGSADSLVKLWDVERGTCIATLAGHREWVEVVRFSRDDRYVLSGGCDSIVRLWEVSSGALVREYRGCTNSIYSIDMSHDGTCIVAAGNDKSLFMWNTVTGALDRVYHGNDYQLYKVLFSPDGRSIITGGKNSIRVWPVDRALESRESPGGTVAVCAMDIDRRSNELVIGCWEYGIKRLSLSTAKVTAHFKTTMSATYTVAVSRSGDRIATGGRSMLTNIVDARTGKQLRWFEHPENVNALALSVNTMHLFTACEDGAARKWDVATGDCTLVMRGHTGPIYGLKLSRTEEAVYTCGADKSVRRWDIVTGACIAEYSGAGDAVNALALSWDGRLLAFGGRDGKVRIFDIESAACVRAIDVGGEVTALSFGITDGVLFTGCDDGAIRMTRLDGHDDTVFEQGHTSRVSSLVIIEKTNCIASAGYDGTMRLWSHDTGKARAVFYNLDRGFLWMTPPDPAAGSGYFYSDRSDLVHVVESDKDGSAPRVFASLDPAREKYIAAMGSRTKVLESMRGKLPDDLRAERKSYFTETEKKLLP